MHFALLHSNQNVMEVGMNSIKCLLTIILLFFSSQSMALFMPADYQVGSVVVVASNETGC